MYVFMIVLIVFSIVFLVMYYPVLRQYIIEKCAKKDYDKEIALLDDWYKEHLVIITERRGEGPSQNSDVQFSKAHENQDFAVKSILSLINELGD